MNRSSSKPHTAPSKKIQNRVERTHTSPEKTGGTPSKPKKAKQVAGSAAANKSPTDPVRLHITPLTAESAKAIVPAKHLSTASYHTLDTFPERSYGFVTIPRADAETLRRKYHGTVFRGVKMSVEEARAVRKPETDANSERSSNKSSVTKKAKADKQDGLLQGFELPEGRQVKRGWTRDGKGKTGASTTAECLFKTILPPVIASEAKKLNFGEEKPKKKSKARTVKNQVVVKEFTNSTKFPSFLKMNNLSADSAERSAEFVEGRGWINEAGDVIENAPAKRRRLSNDGESQESSSISGSDSSREQGIEDTSAKEASTSDSASSDSSSSSEGDSNSHSGEESEEASTSSSESVAVGDSSDAKSSDGLSSSGSSSDSTSDEDSESERESAKEEEEKAASEVVSTSESTGKPVSSNFANLTNIFKPRLSLDTEATSQFNFFGADFDEEEEEDDEEEGAELEGANQENRYRDGEPTSMSFNDSVLYTPQPERYRSGAPTPDTAVAPRFKDFLPFPRDFDISVERDYFPTLTNNDSNSDQTSKSEGAKLLFPHTYSDRLHKISIWSSIKLPNILVKGQLPDKKSDSDQKADDAKEAEDVEMTNIEETVEVPTRPQPGPTHTPKIRDTMSTTMSHQPRTGAGSSVIGWAGKKKTFDDDDDFGMTDAPISGPTKAKTGAGSGVTGWAGKKKTFDDDEGDGASEPTVIVESQAKAKTGAGSGVAGWAGTKKTFDDDDEENEYLIEQPQILSPVPKNTSPPQKKRAHKETQDDAEITSLSVTQAWERVFYENRGDWNRQWKRKKREVAKAKRKKERVKRGWMAAS